jgi:hypothetical protein
MPVYIKGQTTRTRPFSVLVRAANPDFDLERRKEPAWEFEGGRVKRTFYQDIRKFGPYLKEAGQ